MELETIKKFLKLLLRSLRFTRTKHVTPSINKNNNGGLDKICHTAKSSKSASTIKKKRQGLFIQAPPPSNSTLSYLKKMVWPSVAGPKKDPV